MIHHAGGIMMIDQAWGRVLRVAFPATLRTVFDFVVGVALLVLELATGRLRLCDEEGGGQDGEV